MGLRAVGLFMKWKKKSDLCSASVRGCIDVSGMVVPLGEEKRLKGL